MKRALIAGACIAVSACVTFYEQPDADAPHATFNFAKGYPRGLAFNQGGIQEFYLADDDACSNPERVAVFSLVTSAAERRRVEFGQPIHMIAITQFGTYTQSATEYVTEILECRTFANFVPLQGHTYEVIHRTSPRTECSLNIVDNATGVAPPDLVIRHPSPCGPSSIPDAPR